MAPSDQCYACWDDHPHQGGHECDLIDDRTGRRFCHEHMLMIVTWELDGRPDPEEHPSIAAWLDPSDTGSTP